MSSIDKTNGGVAFPLGFRASGVEAHVKYPERKDFALIVADGPATCAGVFTTNAIAAAPVRLDRERVKGGVLRAVAINTGFANACTGAQGEADAAEMARIVASELSVPAEQVAVCSTGVIGVTLPMDRIAVGARLAAAALSREGSADAACAIMTTDTVPKMAAYVLTLPDGRTIRFGAMSKGAGMIEPYMATMLGFVTTDAVVSAADLDEAVREAASVSFNRIVIDNDRSTNDTLMLLASGASGVAIDRSSPVWLDFKEAVKTICLDLAKQMVMDGEGVSKFVTLSVTGAADDAEAERAARSIARSMLVKTSWYGRDPNWGRVIAAAGYSGARVEEPKVRISYGDVVAFDHGRVVADAASLEAMKKIMSERAFTVSVDLGLGSGSCTIYTSDLTHQYVTINADYTT
ncbi:MAG: bifunctional glutamate N-acetyltransferase/amino-acid acetyltransferase ArgJ [Kiritimatiellae bacterium]|nr:bifunctional glutamate N-acetyltransferase/amino-acid acetyltransferase ArgJ [Kiritimatiellia bacterium]